MKPHLTELYNRESLYLHEAMNEFARTHEKIGRRLGMQGSAIGDPFVKRLMQSFSFSAARMQSWLADEFPQLTHDLLETVLPNHTAPTLAAAVARLVPDGRQGDLSAGFLVACGTPFRSRIPAGEASSCTFRSSQDVVLYPLEIAGAQLTGVSPDIPSLNRLTASSREIRGALRLRTTNGAKMSDLQGIDRLPIYLSGDERTTSHLFELMHVASVATVVAPPGRFGSSDGPLHVVEAGAVVHDGLAHGQSLIPGSWPKLHGNTLLQEYFLCPLRFYFFTLAGLAEGLRRIHEPEVEIVVLLSCDDATMRTGIGAEQFSLFCTPVVNLFPLRIDFAEIAARSERDSADAAHAASARLRNLLDRARVRAC